MKEREVSGLVTRIQRLCVSDGPGVRTTVFLKGCPLDCLWCHNPESKQRQPQIEYSPIRCLSCGRCAAVCPSSCHCLQPGHIYRAEGCIACMKCVEICPVCALTVCGEFMSVQSVLDAVLRDLPFYGDEGGLTLSGGEPMAQPEFCLELLRAAKNAHMTTCVETSGFFPSAYAAPLGALCDNLLYDLKDTDDARHRQYTGVSNRLILDNLPLVCAETRVHVRGIIVKGINDTPEHAARAARFAAEAGAESFELFPFHTLGNGKYPLFGRSKDHLPGAEAVPSPREMTRLEAIARENFEAGRRCPPAGRFAHRQEKP